MKIKELQSRFLLSLTLTLMLSAFAADTQAQVYGNEWINFSNTYYKFKIAEEGIFRITKAQLDALGMGNVAGNQFAIFREGAEVPIYTSATGAFGGNDYIELYATKANGKMDTELYPFAAYQGNANVNLISDTAYYFITYDNLPHQRYQAVNNPIPFPAPAPSAYCFTTAYPNENPRNTFAPGRSHEYNVNFGYFYSADFDLGEGYAYNGLGTNNSVNISTPQVNTTSGVNAIVSFAFAGHALTAPPNILQHSVNVSVNSANIFDTSLSGFNMAKRSIAVAPSILNSNNTAINVQDNYNFLLFSASIKYPRNYNFSGNFSAKASFQVPASDRYLEISGFSTGGQQPLLYDITNKKQYLGVESGGVIRFYLDVSVAPKDMFLTNVGSVNNITNFKQIQFRNYSIAVNQGDYIILSHKDYINATPSYTNDFKNYRASAAGGSHSTVVADVTELYDQFGYGFEFHPIAIRRFVKYADEVWVEQPKYLFIIGKGITYSSYRNYQGSANQYSYSPVPTWGDPGSDNLFSSFNNSQKPILATGRLSAWNNQEIGDYLEKVKSYETALKPALLPTVASEYWKKSALHIAGSSELTLQETQLVPALKVSADIYKDSLAGGVVTTIKKNSTSSVEEINSNMVDSLVNKGIHHITFFGHASSVGFDYNLNDPDNYNPKPRFPTFYAYGCNVAHIFTLTQARTVSERYLKSSNGGSIVMIAGNNSGYTGTLAYYMRNFYQSFSYKNYGKILGDQYKNNINYMQDNEPSDFMDIHTQCLIYQGDPALATYSPDLPDYVVETGGLSTTPANVTTAYDSFELKVNVYNLAKATKDSVWLRVEHTKPGNSTPYYTDSLRLPYVLNSDTVRFKIPIDPNKDIGLNNYTVKIDADEHFEEISEENNQAVFQLFIFSENLEPVYPKEFAIVHNQDLTLKASTLNAFAPLRKYRLEIDTTEQFNSSLKQSTEIMSIGGVVKWKPNINYKDSVVYYWRAAPDSIASGTDYSWSYSSFIYLANGSDGWNQSHYYQYRKDMPYTGMSLSEQTGRKFKFTPYNNIYKIENAIVWPWLNNYDQEKETLNDIKLFRFECYHTGALYIAVIDSATGRPWRSPAAGQGGSTAACHTTGEVRETFEFPLGTVQQRNNAKDFLESIPAGNFISIRNYMVGTVWNGVNKDVMMSDTLPNNASGVSLYHTLKNLGFTAIDQFDTVKPFIFFGQKGYPGYPAQQVVGADENSYITVDAQFLSYPDTGIMKSTVVGPALEWQSLKWSASTDDVYPDNDSAVVQVYGIDTGNVETLLYTGYTRDTSLSFIPAEQYPNLKLIWLSVDNISRTSPNLDYWRVLYAPVPEAALNAAAFFQYKDSLSEGEKGKLRIAIENLTPLPMDSMLVKYTLIDAANGKHVLSTKRYKKLQGNDTLIADLEIDANAYPGQNLLLVEANPDNDQPEQYHPNNLGYLSLNMNADKLNPVMDVTFDGVHILDKDIVSAKPLIKVLLRDENKYMALNDSTLMTVKLLYPNQSTPVDVPMDGTICKFIPAQLENDKKNEARIEYKPTLPEDGLYKLIVTGKDRSNNTAGNTLKYDVQFTVENKPSITHVLNYPNPFSTSTQFIFTMTGSEIPSQFKIQILTVTGKVVREIKRHELGELHIGRNMTDYRWDGKDEYGQTLGNGVYLYRVITSIRGENVEQRKNASVDKFFKNGYGKLYIMR